LIKHGEDLAIFFFNEINRARPQVHSLLAAGDGRSARQSSRERFIGTAVATATVDWRESRSIGRRQATRIHHRSRSDANRALADDG